MRPLRYTHTHRFVSLVPFANDEDEESGETVDIWYTSHEFLETQAGDWYGNGLLFPHTLIMSLAMDEFT